MIPINPTLTRRSALAAAAALGTTTTGLLPTAPAAAASNVPIGTLNVWRGRADFKPFAAVIGWQEVEDRAAHQKMRRMMPDNYRHWSASDELDNARNAIPISFRKDTFRLLRSGAERTHEGEREVTPARFVVWVVLQHRHSGRRLAVINTHFISGAWTKHPERRERWLQHAKVLRARTTMLREQGLPVVTVGDFNRREEMSYPGMERFRLPSEPNRVALDQIWRSSTVKTARQLERLGKMGSDVHHAWRVRINF